MQIFRCCIRLVKIQISLFQQYKFVKLYDKFDETVTICHKVLLDLVPIIADTVCTEHSSLCRFLCRVLHWYYFLE